MGGTDGIEGGVEGEGGKESQVHKVLDLSNWMDEVPPLTEITEGWES